MQDKIYQFTQDHPFWTLLIVVIIASVIFPAFLAVILPLLAVAVLFGGFFICWIIVLSIFKN